MEMQKTSSPSNDREQREVGKESFNQGLVPPTGSNLQAFLNETIEKIKSKQCEIAEQKQTALREMGIRGWEYSLKRAQSTSATKLKKIDKEYLEDISCIYTTFQLWQEQHETGEIRPLLDIIAKINAAGKMRSNVRKMGDFNYISMDELTANLVDGENTYAEQTNDDI